MRQFQNLEIRKNHEELLALLDKMKSIKSGRFYYEEEASVRVNSDAAKATTGVDEYALFRANDSSLYNSIVHVALIGDTLKVVNITSSEMTELGITRYNMILNDFNFNFLTKFIDQSYSGSVFITGNYKSLESIIGSDAYQALEQWATTCNKENPISHKNDERMWFDFITRLVQSGNNLHPEDLKQWLSEDMKWASYYNEQIHEMGEKLEYSLSLIKYYVGSNNK